MATREEIGRALQAAHEAGNIEHAKILAQAYADMGEQEKPKESFLNQAKNEALGFSARGHEAFNAINPFSSEADNKKVQAEKEWVDKNTHGIGSMLADMAITAPAGSGATAPIRSLVTGAIEGITHNGGLVDKLKETGLSTLGAGVGEGAANALGFLAHPFRRSGSDIDNVAQELRDKASNLFDLNAAQATGNKSLQYIDSALDSIPSSSGYQQAKKEAQRLKWQEALFKQGGEDANMATPEVMGGMKDRISNVYNDVASRNHINVDQILKDSLNNVASSRNMNILSPNHKPIVEEYLRQFNSAPVGATFSGIGYQNSRSMLDKQSKALRNTNPAESESLRSIRNALDLAMERSVNGNDLSAWKGANNDWSVMKSLERGVDPTTSTIRPSMLLQGLKIRDPNRVIYGQGDQKLNDIAKVGNKFIPPSVPDSGTAQRAMMIKILTGSGAIAGMDEAINHDPAEALGVGGLSLMAAILGPKVAARAMWKKDGYLSKGLIDMEKQTSLDATRQKLLADALRNAGNQTLQESK